MDNGVRKGMYTRWGLFYDHRWLIATINPWIVASQECPLCSHSPTKYPFNERPPSLHPHPSTFNQPHSVQYNPPVDLFSCLVAHEFGAKLKTVSSFVRVNAVWHESYLAELNSVRTDRVYFRFSLSNYISMLTIRRWTNLL